MGDPGPLRPLGHPQGGRRDNLRSPRVWWGPTEQESSVDAHPRTARRAGGQTGEGAAGAGRRTRAGRVPVRGCRRGPRAHGRIRDAARRPGVPGGPGRPGAAQAHRAEDRGDDRGAQRGARPPPRAPFRGNRLRRAPPREGGLASMTARIVIAEDEAIIRMDLREMLEEEGYEVVGEAADGDEVMRLAEQLRPDLVILDIVMPETDGLTAAEHIVEQELAAVLILTAFSHRDKVARATRAGVMAYLVKPFDKADLVPAIEVAVQRWNEARVLANESKNLTERLETRKLVERAKGVLRDRHGLSEEDAFRLIQRISMERGMPMRKVADRLLDGDVWNGRMLS